MPETWKGSLKTASQAEALGRRLSRIDGRGYKAYRDLQGYYQFDDYLLMVDHVQGDPFAAPSRMRVRVSQEAAAFPEDTYLNRSREIALRDFLARCFAQAAGRISRGDRGTGRSGLIAIEKPGQEILERSSIRVTPRYLEARFVLGLPAFGRRVAARQAREMFFEELPAIVRSSLFFPSLSEAALYAHLRVAEDADALRDCLSRMDLIAFIADGAVLPRASGVDPRPLQQGKVVAFTAPESLLVEVELPNRGSITGLGIPRGITLIVGGGYHGKSTLLNAIETGVYNHVPGDGREFVVSKPQALKIRAEDGRSIERVDISPFIANLPFGKDTHCFSTPDASGSTSQAANIMEALEAGAEVLLVDEDTSATNFMIRDHRMQQLVAKEQEPITPFVDKIRLLYQDLQVSTLLVMGGCGDYFEVADTVIRMTEYRPYEVTREALAIARRLPSDRSPEGGQEFGKLKSRAPLSTSLDPSRGKREVKISPKGLHSILFGAQMVDLSSIEQLVDPGQTKAIGDAMYYAKRYMDGNRSLKEILDLVSRDIRERGLEVLSPAPNGDYAAFRPLELACAINRLRSLRVTG